MQAGIVIAVLLFTTIVASLVAAYCFTRMLAMQEKLLQSDDLASARGAEMQYLQLKIEAMKQRGLRSLN